MTPDRQQKSPYPWNIAYFALHNMRTENERVLVVDAQNINVLELFIKILRYYVKVCCNVPNHYPIH